MRVPLFSSNEIDLNDWVHDFLFSQLRTHKGVSPFAIMSRLTAKPAWVNLWGGKAKYAQPVSARKLYVKQGLHLKMKYFFKYAKNTGLSAKKTCIIKRWKKYIFSLYIIDSTYEKKEGNRLDFAYFFLWHSNEGAEWASGDA